MSDFLHFLCVYISGVVFGMYLMTILVDHIEKRRPKTLNLPLDKLCSIKPGHVLSLSHGDNEWSILNSADLEYVADKASMVVKRRADDVKQTGQA